MFTVVQDVVCIGEEFYVYDAEDCVKWFALLSVKECVSRLYEMGEITQCLKVSNFETPIPKSSLSEISRLKSQDSCVQVVRLFFF